MSSNIAGDFCGQPQSHDPHIWTTPACLGSTSIRSPRQCAGVRFNATPAVEDQHDGQPALVVCACGHRALDHNPDVLGHHPDVPGCLGLVDGVRGRCRCIEYLPIHGGEERQ